MSILLDSESEVNIIYPTFIKELSLPIGLIDIEAQKIVDIVLDIYKIVVAYFLVTDKVNQVRFFEKIFLVVNISLEVVFEMFFFTLSNIDVDFLDWEL